MPKQIAVNFSAQEGSSEKGLKNVATKINEYLQANPGMRVVHSSLSFTGYGTNDRPVAHALVIFETN